MAGEGEKIGINGFTLGLAGLRLPLRFLGSDLLMVEGNLTSTVTHVEDRTLVVGELISPCQCQPDRKIGSEASGFD